jgi:protein CpxP
MKLKLLLAAAVGMLGFSSLHAQSADASPSATNEGQNHEHKHHHAFWKALDLTDAQRQQVHQMVEGDKPAAKGLMVNLLNAEKALHDAIAKNPGDEATIRSLSATLGNAKTELIVQRAKVRSQVVGILTPEQKQKLAQWDQKRDDRLQKRVDHLNGSNS